MTFRPSDFFSLDGLIIQDQLERHGSVWDVIPFVEDIVSSMVPRITEIHGTVAQGAYVDTACVYIADGAVVEPTAYIKGPCYVGPGAEVRHGAYIRGAVMLMEGAVLGHASEAKNSLFLPDAKAPHFAYVGDSILGSSVNLGAGTKLSNLGIANAKDTSGKRRDIHIEHGGVRHNTKLSKLGAILGDGCQVGCNAVLNPGSILAPNCLVYPNTSVRRGYYGSGTILKLRQTVDVAQKM